LVLAQINCPMESEVVDLVGDDLMDFVVEVGLVDLELDGLDVGVVEVVDDADFALYLENPVAVAGLGVVLDFVLVVVVELVVVGSDLEVVVEVDFLVVVGSDLEVVVEVDFELGVDVKSVPDLEVDSEAEPAVEHRRLMS
jgi:hypothetical protein